MKMITRFILSGMLAIVGAVSVVAAPVESVDSARASVAFQKVDAFLSEQIVVDQLTALGVSQQETHARLAKLNDSQLEALAAQVDLLQAGGKIVSGHVHVLGPLGCVLHSIHEFTCHVVHFLFCWDDVR